MRCFQIQLRATILQLLLGAWASTLSDKSGELRPIARRHGDAVVNSEIVPSGGGVKSMEMDYKALLRQGRGEAKDSKETFLPTRDESSFVELQQKDIATAERSNKTSPGKITCGGDAKNLVWNQDCWDNEPEYQEFYCEKNSLTLPEPTFVDVCAREGQFRGAYCKKFAEKADPDLVEDCFFPGSEYKKLFCDKMKKRGTFLEKCAKDEDVGMHYCVTFAVQRQGFVECHDWPNFMMFYCEILQNSTEWDSACANHQELGAQYCEDFAMEDEIKADCMQHTSYLKLFCDTKASQNQTYETCATNDHVKGLYCPQMAIQMNGFHPCKAVRMFEETYCSLVDWPVPSCEVYANSMGSESDSGSE